MQKKVLKKFALLSAIVLSPLGYSSEPIPLQSAFDAQDIAWVKQSGNARVAGEAYLKLESGEYKGCAGFNIELLPVADYSSERIFKTYGNNLKGQILLSQNPPRFRPDVAAYHDLVRKTTCDDNNKFAFSSIHAGDYYVMAFIIWDGHGGAVMQRVTLRDDDNAQVTLKTK